MLGVLQAAAAVLQAAAAEQVGREVVEAIEVLGGRGGERTKRKAVEQLGATLPLLPLPADPPPPLRRFLFCLQRGRGHHQLGPYVEDKEDEEASALASPSCAQR